MTLSFVNYLGAQVSIDTSRGTKSSPPKPKAEKYHKGFRVVGLPPGALEVAQTKHNEKQARNKATEKQPFDLAAWLCSAARKPVRAKPYEIRESADVCASLAEKAGWLGVQVREIKKGNE